ncbi:MAG TPA: acyl carrier protein [Labilithrix sp.]|nr:acyl carrier protein [Labilithrix sp.]
MSTSEVVSGLREEEDIVEWLVDRLAAELDISPDDIDVTAPFSNLGVDSIIGVSLSGQLAETFGVDMPATLFWDYPTIERVAGYLAALKKGPLAA